MASLRDYPIKLDSTTLPLADSLWKESYSNVQNTNVSELGTDVVQYVRLGKLKLSLTYTLFESWITTFETYAFGGNTIEVSLWDKATSGYKTHTMRMENYSKNPVAGSQYLENQVGMWQFKFDLIEM